MTLRLAILVVQVIVAACLLYYYALLVAGGRPRRSEKASYESDDMMRFAIAIPAHNEEAVIATTVSQLRDMAYPAERFDVHVVADHCSDATAQMARSAGAIVHERGVAPRGRKGYALAWLLPQLLADPVDYDAVVVFDADSRVEPDFLELMNRALAKSVQVVQGRHVIANPAASTFCALADADMRLANRIRNQAKANLGLSARLMGDAMCIARGVLETHPFGAGSLAEDREYGIQLIAHGVRIGFVPEAVSRGQATARWRDATGQRLRWYAGVLQLQRRYIGPLLKAAARQRSADALAQALDLAVLPFSLVCALALLLAAVTALMPSVSIGALLVLSLSLAGAALAYPVVGLLAERAPWSGFRALIYGPFYVAWRVWVGLKAQLLRDRVPWIRTEHTKESE